MINRYTVEGIVNDARSGKSVMVLGLDPTYNVKLFEDCVVAAVDADMIRRTRGQQEIRYDLAGRIAFVSYANAGHRGASADVVAVNMDWTPEIEAEVVPIVVARRGEIVWL